MATALDARGKVALVVGAASGMGRLAAQRWAEAGGIAVGADVNEAGLKETAQGHPRIDSRVVDVTDALVRMDDGRRAAVYDLLAEISQRRQVILLTCHAAVAAALERDLGLRRLELSG